MRPNPSLKRNANGRGTKPALEVRGVFSPARAWPPAVVARLARTLIITRLLLPVRLTSDFQAYKAKGVEFVREPKEEPYGTVAVFKDLYGNLWDLLEPRSHNGPSADA